MLGGAAYPDPADDRQNDVLGADAESDVTGRRWEQRVEVMTDAIIYNRNNPSIVFYESGNRGVSAEHQLEMKALRDKYDPHGGRASGSREMLSKQLQQVAEYVQGETGLAKGPRNTP